MLARDCQHHADVVHATHWCVRLPVVDARFLGVALSRALNRPSVFCLNDEAGSDCLGVLGHAGDRDQLVHLMLHEIVHLLIDGVPPLGVIR